MRKYAIYLFVVVFSTFLSGCEKDITTQDHSTITHFVTFEIKGVNAYNETAVALGSDYVDQGVVAMEGDKDVTSSVAVSGEVDTSTLGVYTISYSATNKDGYSSTVERTVLVYDPSASLSSTDLTGSYDGLRINAGAGGTVDIHQVIPGIFYISDMFAGYYAQSKGYGKSYAAPGYFMLNSDNSITFITGYVSGWASPIIGSNATYDPATKTISFTSTFDDGSGFGFDVQLTSNE